MANRRPLVLADNRSSEIPDSDSLLLPGVVGYLLATAGVVSGVATIPNTDITGLGTAAVKNTGTSGNNVPLLDGANTWSAAQTFSADALIRGATGSAFAGTAGVAIGGTFPAVSFEGSATPWLLYKTGDEVKLYHNTSATTIQTWTSTGTSITGTVSASNEIRSTGSASALSIDRRDTSAKKWTIYSAAGNFQLYNQSSGAEPFVVVDGAPTNSLVVGTSGTSITGTLSTTGNITSTGNVNAGATGSGDGVLQTNRSNNTNAIQSAINVTRGNASGVGFNFSSVGDASNGVAAFLARFDGSEIQRWTSTGTSITGTVSVAGAANSAPFTHLRLDNTGTTSGGPGIASRIRFTAGATELGFIQGANHVSGKAAVQISGNGSAVHATIDSDGNVGINTTTPATKCEIYDASTGAILTFNSGTNGSARGMHWRNAATSNNFGSITADYTSGLWTYDAGLAVYAGQHAFRVGTSGEKMRISASGVAITGTLSSTGNYTCTGNVIQVGTSGNGTGGNFRMVDDSGTTRWLTGILGGVGATSWDLYDVVAATSRITVNSSGNVGIGTSSPGAKLHVNGAAELARLQNDNAYISFYNSEGSARSGYLEMTVFAGKLWVEVDKDLIFGTNNSERLRIRNSGLIGVMNASPTAFLHLPASTTSYASLRLPHGSAPSSPNDGDMWTTTAGLYVRINGTTVGPLT